MNDHVYKIVDNIVDNLVDNVMDNLADILTDNRAHTHIENTLVIYCGQSFRLSRMKSCVLSYRSSYEILL